VKPSEILGMLGGIVLGLGTLAIAVFMYVDRNSAKPWHFWIAPLLAVATAAALTQLAVGYYMKVGRLETKGRPRSE
jgi:fucose permease